MNSVIIPTKIIVFKGSNGLVNYSIKYINFTIKDNILNILVSRYKTILIYIINRNSKVIIINNINLKICL